MDLKKILPAFIVATLFVFWPCKHLCAVNFSADDIVDTLTYNPALVASGSTAAVISLYLLATFYSSDSAIYDKDGNSISPKTFLDKIKNKLHNTQNELDKYFQKKNHKIVTISSLVIFWLVIYFSLSAAGKIRDNERIRTLQAQQAEQQKTKAALNLEKIKTKEAQIAETKKTETVKLNEKQKTDAVRAQAESDTQAIQKAEQLKIDTAIRKREEAKQRYHAIVDDFCAELGVTPVLSDKVFEDEELQKKLREQEQRLRAYEEEARLKMQKINEEAQRKIEENNKKIDELLKTQQQQNQQAKKILEDAVANVTPEQLKASKMRTEEIKKNNAWFRTEMDAIRSEYEQKLKNTGLNAVTRQALLQEKTQRCQNAQVEFRRKQDVIDAKFKR